MEKITEEIKIWGLYLAMADLRFLLKVPGETSKRQLVTRALVSRDSANELQRDFLK